VEIHTEKGETEGGGSTYRIGERWYCRYNELLGTAVRSGRMCADRVLRACMI